MEATEQVRAAFCSRKKKKTQEDIHQYKFSICSEEHQQTGEQIKAAAAPPIQSRRNKKKAELRAGDGQKQWS